MFTTNRLKIYTSLQTLSERVKIEYERSSGGKGEEERFRRERWGETGEKGGTEGLFWTWRQPLVWSPSVIYSFLYVTLSRLFSFSIFVILSFFFATASFYFKKCVFYDKNYFKCVYTSFSHVLFSISFCFSILCFFNFLFFFNFLYSCSLSFFPCLFSRVRKYLLLWC